MPAPGSEAFVTSSYSANDCVGVARSVAGVHMGDSKTEYAEVVKASPDMFAAFVDFAKRL